ncbi:MULTISPECIES: DNA internalization-related competence protein ComEC/Rec2 [Aliiglaciecola]|uniref:DNA internalization-related competence protein ComEC/Rec2 n=1 Tax=Aliiglaciecola TaxID=1406885 RepID=UPI001C092046|nr:MULTISPECIES: DNA internalization-related competence protein ComEC/Rec2 [Aliiglaciecola]MBU2878289.1 DNA internalization-related competence protein ComEC/Rec2 [Aliiglaciecola lipolytica]MDO6711799.1 DNA internalization-related competence protein ComEC/Rec2 [Aliiglaciecola sp. 2_MG-2023]MDO6753027.1 DNA internalization-related competence protein ComEC/Rec2 [Aliiglaciecola sp. 1_MG-2023]
MLNTIQRNKQLWLVSFVTIAVSSILWTHLPSSYLLPVLLLIAWLFTRNPLVMPFSSALFISGALFAIVWMASVGHWRVNWQLPEQDIRQIRQVTGSIETIVSAKQSARFNLIVASINGQTHYRKSRIRLTWKSPTWPLKQGQVVALKIKLKPIHGLANEGSFVYQKWLLSQNIVATGYVLNKEAHLINDTSTLRQQLIDKFERLNLQHSGWIAAITFGDRSGLEADDWQMIQATGVAHLVAISGLHLGVVAWLCYLLFNLVLRLLCFYSSLSQRINYHHISLLTTLICTFFYAYLAGFSLPTLRAWIMLSVWAVLLITARFITFKWFILGNIFIFILIAPMSLLSASFWLSFGAIAFIGLVTWLWPAIPQDTSAQTLSSKIKQKCKVVLRLQLMLCFLMMPIVAVYFSMISVSSPIVNLLAVPLVTLCIVPMCLIGCLLLLCCEYLAAFVFSWIDWMLDNSLDGLAFFAQMSWSRIELPGIPILVWACVFLVLLAVCMPIKSRFKVLSFIGIIPLISYFLPANTDTWKVHILDVGQGLSVLIEQDQKALLYDTGAAYPSGFNMAQAVVLPVLKSQNITSLDWVIVSHFDNDHAGSLAQLFAGVKVTGFISNQDVCDSNLFVKWHDLTITGLWPLAGSKGIGNDHSCVVLVSDGHQSILLPGDISKQVEHKLMNKYQSLLNVDILVAAHHGSDTSSVMPFIRATAPQYAIFSQGYLNRWDFPKQQVVNRYVEQDIHLISTAESGQISFELSLRGEPIKVIGFRDKGLQSWFNRYLWH